MKESISKAEKKELEYRQENIKLRLQVTDFSLHNFSFSFFFFFPTKFDLQG